LRGAGALAGAAHGGQVDKRVAIRIHEIFEQARDFGLGGRVLDVIDQAGERENLALA